VVLDATGVPVGRLAVEAAKILRGKHKPIFTPHMDTGDHVIIINAERAVYTGNNKRDEPIYRHTLYRAGSNRCPRGEFLTKRPEDAILRTVKGCSPTIRWARDAEEAARVPGRTHPHEAQIKGAAGGQGGRREATGAGENSCGRVCTLLRHRQAQERVRQGLDLAGDGTITVNAKSPPRVLRPADP
jgi:large subunit ribosomal protein L13